MGKWENKHTLLAIFVAVVVVRLVLAFATPHFTYDSYFHLRQVESIGETGLPLYQDELSYGGRELHFLPFFHYVMAFFDLFLPLELAAKIIPNLFIASLTIIAYLLAQKVTTHAKAPLFSAFIAGFLPVFFSPNAFRVESLFIPLIFLTVYSFTKVQDDIRFLYAYIGLFFLSSLTSSATALLIIGFGIYLLLSFVEGKRVKSYEIEIIFFSLLFFVWIQFLFFKETLIREGIAFVWQNIPAQIIEQYFPKLSIFEAVVSVSVIPFITGVYIVYQSLFKLKDTRAFLFISLVISTTILAWLRLIEFRTSLAFFSVILAVLFALFYQDVINFIQKTKLRERKKWFSLVVVVLLVVTMVPPALNSAFSQNIPSPDEVEAFVWLENSVPGEVTVAALLEEGNLITYYGKKKNIVDDHFSLVEDSERRFKDVNSLFVTSFQTQALDIFSEYKASYIVLTPTAKKRYGIEKFRYLKAKCFSPVYNKDVKIYKVKCVVQEKK